MALVHQLGFHFLYCGLGAVMIVPFRGLRNRRRGLPFFHGWLSVVRLLAVFLVWTMLPWPWHLYLAGALLLVGLGLLIRDSLQPGAPPGAKTGKGTA